MTTVIRHVHFTQTGKRKRAIRGPAPEPTEPRGRTPRVAKLMALAIRFDRLLQDGAVANQSELARLAHITQPRMTQIMNLLHLAPDIQEEILFLPKTHRNRDPFSTAALQSLAREHDWQRQREMWTRLKAGESPSASRGNGGKEVAP